MIEKLKASLPADKKVSTKKAVKSKPAVKDTKVISDKSIANSLMRADNKAYQYLKIESGGQLYSDVKLQKKYKDYLDLKMVDILKGKKTKFYEYEKVFDLLALSGYYGKKDHDSYVDNHKKYSKLNLDPSVFSTTQKKDEAPKEKDSSKASSKDSKEHDCDELIDREKKRKAKIKEAAKKRASEPTKTPATKNKETIHKAAEKVEDNILKRIDSGKVSKSELQKLIDETESLLNKLKAALKKL